MSLKIDRVQLDIVINNDQARQQLRRLEGEYKDLAKQQKKFTEGSAEYEKLKQQMIQVKMQMDKVYESIGIANLSLKELQKRQSELNSVLAHMSPSMKGYTQLKAEADAVGARLKELKKNSKDTDFSIGKMADGFNRYFAFVTAGLASLTGLIFSLRKVVDIANLFEERVDNLSALTGLLGEDLEWLSEEAKNLSTSVIEGNIRIKSTATEIVDAYTKVGSKRPELLAVKEDLNAVTKEAMILSAAAKSDLEPAVAGLTMVLNQFNAPASESRRIINVLAAGSKEGAGEVEYLTAGFEKSGSVANSFGISVEELTGTLETLAPRITEAEMAGRSLRNIMIYLETTGDQKLMPSVVGLQGAFEELKKRQTSVGKLTKLVGQENINAANILMNNTAEMKKYTEAVTGTNIALEQAATNTDNNTTKLQQAKNKVEVISIEFGQKLAPAMTFSTNVFAAFMRVVMGAPAFVHQYNTALIALAGLTLAYNANLLKSIAMKGLNNLLLKEGIGLKIKDAIALQFLIAKEQLLTIWKGNGTVATKLATTAQYAWNAAMKANPIGLVITAITALVVAIKSYDKYNAESIRLEREKEAALNQLAIANNSLKSAIENQSVVLSALNKLSYEDKKLKLEQFDATLKLAEAELLLQKAKQKDILLSNTRTTLWQKFTNSIKAGTNIAAFAAMQAEDALINGGNAALELQTGIEDLSASIKGLRNQAAEVSKVVNAEMFADDITGNELGQLEEKLSYLNTALKNYEKGSEGYIRVSKKISETTKLMQQSTDDNTNSQAKQLTNFEKLQAEISKLNKELIDMLLAGKTPPDEFLSNLKKMEQKVIDVNNAVAVSKNGLESYIKISPDVEIKDEPFKPDQDETIIGDYIDTDYYAKQTELYQQLNDRKLDLVQQGIDGAKNLLMAASQAQYQHDVNLMNQKYDKEKQKLEDQLNSNAISREVYDKKVAALDKKRSAEDLKLRRKQAIREKEIATLGIGVDTAKAIFEIKAKAAAFLAGVTTAPLAAVALAQIPWVLGAAALQTGLVWAQPMPQAYMGKNLNVTGASDGRLYKNVPYAGDAKTGMYRHPTLIADHGSEIVIDHFRSRNITMNYPEILEAIRAVPQHYSGRVPEASYSNNTVSLALSAELIAAMNRFTAAALKLDKDGVELNYQKLTDLQEKVQNIESLTSF